MVDSSPLLDAEYRLNHCYFIVDKAGKRSQFKQNAVQRRLNYVTARRRRILKARQMGVSTNELLRQLDFVLFSKNKNACILAHEQDGIEKLFRIVRRAYEFMDPSLKPELAKGGGSKYEMFFPKNNSRIYCDLSSRGDTIHWLHVSEKAFIEDIDRVYATVEAVPMDGIVTEETTANGMNHFYDSWMDGDSNYTNIFFPWYFHEEYTIPIAEITPKQYSDDERHLVQYAKAKYGMDITPGQIAFRRFKQRELKQMFKQEYPEDDMTCFLTSGNAPFSLEIIKPMYDNAPKPIEVVDGIRVYKKQSPGGIYVIGADTAEGVGGDACAAHVFNIRGCEQVASFNSTSIKPSEFAEKLVQMAEMYGTRYPGTLIGVERNNHGHSVLLKLDEVLEYPNIFKTYKEEKKSDIKEIRLGWITDRVTRPIMVDTFIEGVENGTIKLNDRETLGECLTLINNDGKIEAEEGKHDDLVMAACIAVQMSIEEGKLSIYDNAASKIKI